MASDDLSGLGGEQYGGEGCLSSLPGSVGTPAAPFCLRPPQAAPELMFKGLSGQVILCTKEVSVGARKNAFALLLEMGRAFLRFGPNQEGEGLGYMLCSQVSGSTPPNH